MEKKTATAAVKPAETDDKSKKSASRTQEKGLPVLHR